jgi:hypothetical protein
MRNRSVELKRGGEENGFKMQNERKTEDVKLDYDVTLNHKIMFMNNVSAVPLAKGKEAMPPAGKASTVLKRSVVEATYGNNEDEISRLQNTLSSLTIDKERVSNF